MLGELTGANTEGMSREEYRRVTDTIYYVLCAARGESYITIQELRRARNAGE